MKWEKAIEQIKAAQAGGANHIEISYHRKWARNSHEFKQDTFDCIATYIWDGKECKAILTRYGMIDEGNYIVDEVHGERLRNWIEADLGKRTAWPPTCIGYKGGRKLYAIEFEDGTEGTYFIDYDDMSIEEC